MDTVGLGSFLVAMLYLSVVVICIPVCHTYSIVYSRWVGSALLLWLGSECTQQQEILKQGNISPWFWLQILRRNVFLMRKKNATASRFTCLTKYERAMNIYMLFWTDGTNVIVYNRHGAIHV